MPRTAKFADNSEYVAARRSYIRAISRFVSDASDQEIINEVAAMYVAFLTIAERKCPDAG